MALRDYSEEVRLNKRKLCALICIYQKQGYALRSCINDIIESVVSHLKAELCDYESIQLGYVFETSSLQGYVPFTILKPDTVPYYTEPLEETNDHNLDHLFFMSMALLEQKKTVESTECRLYLVTDDRFERVNEIVWMDEDGLSLNHRFSDSHIKIIIVRNSGAGGGAIEQFLNDCTTERIIIYDE